MPHSERPISPRERFRLSVVIPMFNEEEVCDLLFARLLPCLEDITEDFEIVCVDDGSRDSTLDKLLFHHAKDARIKILSLSRNFGKERALTAGLDYASGDAVIPFDADLQDPPEVIPRLVKKWQEGYDMVLAVRGDRRSDSWAKRLSADLFYRFMGRFSNVPMPVNAGDFRLMDRRVVEAVMRLPERTRFMKGLFAWAGFRQTSVAYTRPARPAGKSKFKAWKLWNFALEGVLSFSTLPLRMWTYLGLFVSIPALGYMTYIILRTLIFGVDVPGYASLLVAILFFSGINMIGLGVMGEYLGRVFIEVKQRPLYLVRDAIGFSAQSKRERDDSLTLHTEPMEQAIAQLKQISLGR